MLVRLPSKYEAEFSPSTAKEAKKEREGEKEGGMKGWGREEGIL